MKEIKDIIKAYDTATKQGRQTALATVVHVEGSSYRRPGARMLVTDEGNLTGAISGGCLEGDALRKALQAMTENRNRLVTYDTNDEDDAKLGMGLGCNGIIQVLFEPIDPSNAGNPIKILKAVAAKRQQAVIVTLFSIEDKKTLQPGTCLLVNEEGSTIGNVPALQQRVVADAKNSLMEKRSAIKNYSAVSSSVSVTAFIEFIQPAVSVVVAGAGNDVKPLVEIASLLGWETTVIDGRPAYARSDRFPSACQVLVTKPEDLLRQITIDRQTVFVLMSHNYIYDMAILKELVIRNAVYIGLLGPRKKRERIIGELKENGLVLSAGQLETIHGPVGLDIGAETAEEIALSIIAEIKAVLSGKEGTLLKNCTATIHARSAYAIETIKLNPREKLE